MNSLVKPFDFKGTPVRTVTFETGLTWWVLKDVCDALNLSNPTMIAQRLDDDEQSKIDPKSGLGSVSNTPVNIVNEAGLYKIILRSDKPEAKEFQRWVTHEVLPSIRRHGGYMAGQESMTPEQMALASMRWLQSTVAEQERRLQAQAPKVLFADALETSKDSILIGQLAKLLKQNGVEIGQNRLYAWLRDNGYLSSRHGDDWNTPTQKAMDMRLFQIRTNTVIGADGRQFVNHVTLVTGKGQQYLINKCIGKAA